MPTRVIFAFIALATATACAVTKNPAEIGPYPNNHKMLVKDYVLKAYKDPHSLRDVARSYPVEGHLYFQQGWIVCFQANAKNSYGGYVGLERDAFLIKNGEVVASMSDAKFCDQVPMVPWPEMEGPS